MSSSGERPSRTHKASRSYAEAVKTLGLRIRALRHDRGLTLEQAAERMDLDWKHLQKIESGTLNVTLVTVLRVAEGLGEPLAELFTSAIQPARRRYERRGKRKSAAPSRLAKPTK